MRLPLRIPVCRSHRLARFFCRGDIAALRLGANGRLAIERGDGSVAEAVIESSTTVFPWLVVLRYRSDGRCASLALIPQAIGSEAHRRLRVWLEWRAAVD